MTHSSTNSFRGMPPQKLTSSKKDENWQKKCVDAIVGLGFVNQNSGGRNNREQKQINYNIVNGIINESDFKYLLNPYNLNTEEIYVNSPGQFRNYNIILPKLNRMKGEALRRPFPFEVFGINGDVVSQKQEEIKATLIDYVLSYAFNMARNENGQAVDAEGNVMEEPEQIRSHMMSSYKTVVEDTASKLLNYLYHNLNLRYEFNRGLEHGLISGEEIYRVGIVNGEPYLRAVNPLYCDFERTPDQVWIQDCQWFREDRYMTPGDILDEYGEYLTEKEIDEIEKGFIPTFRPREDIIPGVAYSSPIEQSSSHYADNSEFIQVNVCVWKSMKKMGFLRYMDEELGEIVEEIVDDSYKLTEEHKEAGIEVEWRWVTEVWEGTKIGNSIYVNIRPVPNQVRETSNWANAKLPYIGSLYNMTNSKATSFVDFLKPYQYLLNIMWYRLEEEIAKAKGKKFIMDLAQLPKSSGFDLEKWLQYFDNMGIGFINSKEEGKQQLGPNAASSFNQFQAVDMSLSQAVGQYIGIISKIEEVVDNVSGISRQAQGQIQSGETASGIRQSINNSAYVTEIYFYTHTEIKKQVLTQLLEVAKLAYMDGKEIQYILDDVGLAYLKVDGAQMSLSEFGVFVSDTLLENINREKLEQLAFAAMQNQMLNFSDLASLYTGTSINKSISKIKMAEFERQQQTQQAQEQENQLREQELQQQASMEQMKMENDNLNKDLDRQTDIQVATIRALGFSNDPDVDKDGQSDIIEQNKMAMDQMKIAIDSVNKQRELDIKEKEIMTKKEIEDKKAETALKIAKENKNKYDSPKK